MVNFSELKQKAEKVKDAGVTKMVNTKDKFTSVPSAKTNWDPNWKRAPPSAPAGSASTHRAGAPSPPLRARPNTAESLRDSVSSSPPPVLRGSRPDVPSPLSHSPLPPPPTRPKSSYAPRTGTMETTEQIDHIDWTNLSQEDKNEFFSWLDEFFSRSLNISLPPRYENSVVETKVSSASGPPPVNLSSRPLS